VKADRARLLVTAVAGIVLAHAADYALAFPDPARRAHNLSATGHGYWPVALAAAVVCGGLGLALAIRRGWHGTSPSISVPATAGRLAVGQVVLFGVLETVERLAVGGHPLPFLISPQFALGVALQVAVAVAAAVLLRSVERGARRVARALRRPPRNGECRRPWAPPADDAVLRWWGISGDARGPPPALPA
jgi:hypothetical protein